MKRFNDFRDIVSLAGRQVVGEAYNAPIGTKGLTSDCFGVWTRAMRSFLGNASDAVNFGYVGAIDVLSDVLMRPAYCGRTLQVIGDTIELRFWSGSEWLLARSFNADQWFKLMGTQCAQRAFITNPKLIWFALSGRSYDLISPLTTRFDYDHLAYFDASNKVFVDRVSSAGLRYTPLSSMESADKLGSLSETDVAAKWPLETAGAGLRSVLLLGYSVETLEALAITT